MMSSFEAILPATNASAASGVPTPEGSAFAGEVSLTGQVRPVPALAQRIGAARASGCTVLYAGQLAPGGAEGIHIVPVHHVREAVTWALSAATMARKRLPA
jgi:DNA repair protein RadA/Sms